MVTARQHQTYLFIRHYILQNGYAPTEAEVAGGIGITSRGTVHRYIHALVDANLLTVLPNRRRNIRLVEDQVIPYCTLPIIGEIAAGKPIEAVKDQRVLDLAQRLLGPNRFVLEVKGDSMIGDNIREGDYIICESQESAEEGEIVVAQIDEQDVTLKHLKHNDDNTISLLSSNPNTAPMIYSADRVQVKGVYIGLLRLSELMH